MENADPQSLGGEGFLGETVGFFPDPVQTLRVRMLLDAHAEEMTYRLKQVKHLLTPVQTLGVENEAPRSLGRDGLLGEKRCSTTF